MRMHRLIGTVLAGTVLSVTAATTSSAQSQRVPAPAVPAATDDVLTVQPQMANQAFYLAMPWETRDLVFPALPKELVQVVQEDDQQMTFVNNGELGGFRAAPKGGTVFFGAGLPLWGPASPPVLSSGTLRPLGNASGGFLGTRPPVDPVTVIPKLDGTSDASRASYAFVNGPPPLSVVVDDGSAFPAAATVAADTTPGLPDNIPAPTTTDPGTTPTTNPPTPGTSIPASPPTTASPGPPASGPTPGTTIPPRRPPVATPTTRPTTTTTTPRPTTTTTPRPTTTTTTTTAPTTTTTTPPPPVFVSTFVLGNQRDEASYCLSTGSGGTSNQCDRLFDLTGITPGEAQSVRLTLWNVDPASNTHAVALRAFAPNGCTSGTSGPSPHGSSNLCDGLRIRIDRYSDAARTGDQECLAGCTGPGVSLTDFAASHASMADGMPIDDSFRVAEKAYLVVTVRLPDTGTSASGVGNDNPYMGRTAGLRLTWRMDSQ